MTDATLDAWLCKACNDVSPGYNFPSEHVCRWCGAAKPDVVSLEQISVNSPAALELMGQQPQKAAKRGKLPVKGQKQASENETKLSKKEALELRFLSNWERFGTGHTVTRQYVVKSGRHVTPKTRKPKTYKIDFAWPELMFAAECQGGTYKNGAHSRGAGYAADRKRIRDLSLMGWTVWEYTTDDLQDSTIISTILEVNEKIRQIEAGLVKELAA